MKSLIAVSTLLFTLQASAECPSRVPASMPEIPDGTEADAATMSGARAEVQTYVTTIEAYLQCRDPELADSSYNALVDKAVLAAGFYNRELRRYEERQGMLAKY